MAVSDADDVIGLISRGVALFLGQERSNGESSSTGFISFKVISSSFFKAPLPGELVAQSLRLTNTPSSVSVLAEPDDVIDDVGDDVEVTESLPLHKLSSPFNAQGWLSSKGRIK